MNTIGTHTINLQVSDGVTTEDATGTLTIDPAANAGGPYEVTAGNPVTLTANPDSVALGSSNAGTNNGILKNEFQFGLNLLGILPVNVDAASLGTISAATVYSGGVLQSVQFNSANLTLADTSGTANYMGEAGLTFSLTGVHATLVSSAPESVTPDGNSWWHCFTGEFQSHSQLRRHDNHRNWTSRERQLRHQLRDLACRVVSGKSGYGCDRHGKQQQYWNVRHPCYRLGFAFLQAVLSPSTYSSIALTSLLDHLESISTGRRISSTVINPPAYTNDFALDSSNAGTNNGILKNEFSLGLNVLGVLPVSVDSPTTGDVNLATVYNNGVLQNAQFISGSGINLGNVSGSASNGIAGLTFSLTGVHASIYSTAPETVTPDGNGGGTISLQNTNLVLNAGQLTIQGTGALSSIVYSIDFGQSPESASAAGLGLTSTITVGGGDNATFDFHASGAILTLLQEILSPSTYTQVQAYIAGGTYGIDFQGTANLTTAITQVPTYAWTISNPATRPFHDCHGSRSHPYMGTAPGVGLYHRWDVDSESYGDRWKLFRYFSRPHDFHCGGMDSGGSSRVNAVHAYRVRSRASRAIGEPSPSTSTGVMEVRSRQSPD